MLPPLGLFGLGDDNLIPCGIVTADLALQEIGAALEEVEHW